MLAAAVRKAIVQVQVFSRSWKPRRCRVATILSNELQHGFSHLSFLLPPIISLLSYALLWAIRNPDDRKHSKRVKFRSRLNGAFYAAPQRSCWDQDGIKAIRNWLAFLSSVVRDLERGMERHSHYHVRTVFILSKRSAGKTLLGWQKRWGYR